MEILISYTVREIKERLSLDVEEEAETVQRSNRNEEGEPQNSFSHTLDGWQYVAKKSLSTHCCTPRVGPCIRGNTPARSRTMPSSPRCPLDDSWSRVTMCSSLMNKTNQSTPAVIISSLFFLCPLLSELHCETFCPCLKHHLSSVSEAAFGSHNVSVFNDLLSQ